MIANWIALVVCSASLGFIVATILDGAPKWLWSLVVVDALAAAVNVIALAGAL